MASQAKQRILIVGAGAAGMACAWSLARFQNKFEVHVWEAEAQAGGVATSEELADGHFINDGVQGGSSSYRNTLLLHQHFGFKPQTLGFRVCFGKGEFMWNNYAETTELSPLVKRLAADIERFGRLLTWILRLELIFIFVPISTVLKLFRFSEDFGSHMVYPLTALFFGTGNKTSSVSSAVVARVFLDPDLCLFPYDPVRLMSAEAPMFAFQKLSEIYHTMTTEIEAQFQFRRPVAAVERLSSHSIVTDTSGKSERFDQVVFACNADVALRLLASPSRAEQFCLGNVRYYEDVTITHCDTEYMQQHYTMAGDVAKCREAREMYYIRTEPSDRSKCEMGFNLSAYQPQLSNAEQPIYQTIFLNSEESSLWTRDKISKSKVLLEKWWHQFAHEAAHFYSVVPFVRFIQNTQRSWYCGAYTLVNTHEIATISGLAVAHRLGAPYPFAADELARKQFDTYLMAIHGVGTTRLILSWLGRVIVVVLALLFAAHMIRESIY